MIPTEWRQTQLLLNWRLKLQGGEWYIAEVPKLFSLELFQNSTGFGSTPAATLLPYSQNSSTYNLLTSFTFYAKVDPSSLAWNLGGPAGQQGVCIKYFNELDTVNFCRINLNRCLQRFGVTGMNISSSINGQNVPTKTKLMYSDGFQTFRLLNYKMKVLKWIYIYVKHVVHSMFGYLSTNKSIRRLDTKFSLTVHLLLRNLLTIQDIAESIWNPLLR